MFMETGTPEFERVGDKICWKVKLNVNTWFEDPTYQFCSDVKEMISIQEALHLQLTRLAYVLGAQTEAKVADEESTKTTGVRFTGEEEVFGDSTWFRRYNALDTSSWSPEIPVEYQKVQTPLQRWHEAASHHVLTLTRLAANGRLEGGFGLADERFQLLTVEVAGKEGILPTLVPRALADVAWSCGRLVLRDSPLAWAVA
eukprot:s1276_g21.t1